VHIQLQAFNDGKQITNKVISLFGHLRVILYHMNANLNFIRNKAYQQITFSNISLHVKKIIFLFNRKKGNNLFSLNSFFQFDRENKFKAVTKFKDSHK
jgi:ADP-heptose:LPS heptosyltransferase